MDQLCLCGGAAGYPASHTYDCPRPYYAHGYEDPNSPRIEAWERDRIAKGARLRAAGPGSGEKLEEPEADNTPPQYAPGSGEYNDMMFGDY